MTPAERAARGLRGPQLIVLWGGAAAMLLAPAIAMQFTTEVAWGFEDFATLALMLVGAGGTLEVAARRTTRLRIRSLIGATIGLAFLLTWALLAVGS